GVPLVIDSENCVFPQSQSSQTIIDCFLSESKRLGIEIQTSHGIRSMRYLDQQWELELYERAENPPRFDKVIIATGGSPKRTGLEWLEKLGHQIEEPVPSLFTFNLPQTEITRLQGVVVENALVSLVGTKLKSDGPLLITHWGFSGPVILKLSAFGARILSDLNYQCPVQVNWIHETNQTVVLDELMKISRESANKNLSNVRPFRLPERLWLFLLEKCDLPTSKKWSEIGKKSLNKLVNLLTNDIYTLDGKTTFKEEFVTCGGVSLKSIDLETMKSKVCENLYFAGEILDIDGITGGYNFQAAWTTGFV
ncbi:MAG TPA: aminoacetone oxidase family FAD-binding enzyme, partial [Candidatus Marinimicrobia bacterium]|nr:aminoacetone oxidase family FAD-binding enzyme [Candidatus Neomarinimicrobiota bacterium]